jgi:site-specific DNA-methyltransferase (adenine-specific)
VQTFSNDSGVAICADAFDPELPHRAKAKRAALVILDPPYGNIVTEYWDKEVDYPAWFELAKECAAPEATICIWGGIGKPGNRPFLEFLVGAEGDGWVMSNLITWGKRRAYGVPDNYLFTREECAIFTRGEPVFNVPYLKEKRGYPGYNPKYPAKSDYKRRNNVWVDITELFKGKIHPTQKPDALFEVLICTHSTQGDLVIDLCAGSMVTARAAMATGRKFYCVERDSGHFETGVATLGQNEPSFVS